MGASIKDFADFVKSRDIDRPTMVKILEDVFRTMIRKKYEHDDNFDVIINPEEGDLEIWRIRTIIDDNSEDIWDYNKIPFSEAKKIEDDYEVGEEVAEIVPIKEFGRRAVMTAKHTFMQRVKDIEKESVFNNYKELVGEVITAEVTQIINRGDVLLLDEEGNELIIPKMNQIAKDYYRKGDMVKAIIDRIEVINGNPKIILSRTSPKFMERLFEAEVPEIYDGLITIKKVVREPGERAKIAVESYDDRIDPVGACVGMKGSRIHSIVRELQNENIDVINYTENQSLYISRALNPAKISKVEINEEERRISIFLNADQVSLAIGKGGQNIKLASRLVDYEIDVFREDSDLEDDVSLSEFSDEIESWIIEALNVIGLDTAKNVLNTSKEDLVKRSDLEESTIEEVIQILKKEFE